MIKKIKRKKKQTQLLKKTTKAILINLVLLYLMFGVAVMPITWCYFVDVETSKDNEFTAGSLDFSLRDDVDNKATEKLFDGKINYSEEIIKNVFVKKEGSVSFEYKITAEKTDGSDAVCDALKVGIERDGTGGIYTGSLLSLNPSLDITGSQDEISFRIYLDDNNSALQDKNCQFKINFSAKQQGISDGGFSSSRSITDNKIETGWWVEPDVKVLSPNGGETWLAGSTHDIKWEATSTDPSATDSMKINIYLSTDGGATYPTQLATDTENDGSFGWTISDKSATMKIKVKAEDEHGLSASDESNDVFDPAEPVEETVSETSGEVVSDGSSVENSAPAEEEKVEAPSEQSGEPETSGADSAI